MVHIAEGTGVDVRERTEADEVYAQLKQQIAALQLRPEATYREADLQDQFGVGRGALREALYRLQYERMLQIYPRQGIRIATLSVSDMREMYEVRLALETAVASMAAQRHTDSERAELEALAAEVRSGQTSEDQVRYNASHRQFHLLIARCARNRSLEQYIEHSLTLNHWLWNLYDETRMDPTSNRSERFHGHDELVAAITSRNPAVASEAMHEHIIRAKERLLAGL